MLAQRLPGILPPLSLEEALQDAFGHFWSAEVFRGETWPALAGMYEIPAANLGSPYRTIFMQDVPSKRIYGINVYTFNPQGDKPFNANSGWLYGMEDVRGYDSIIPKQYTDYMAAIEPQGELKFNRVQPIGNWESLNPAITLWVKSLASEGDAYDLDDAAAAASSAPVVKLLNVLQSGRFERVG